jgi:hypothetical protein
MNVIRGNNLECDTDAVMWIGQQKFYVELDTGEMSYQRVQNRWKSYELCRSAELTRLCSAKVLHCLERKTEKLMECLPRRQWVLLAFFFQVGRW